MNRLLMMPMQRSDFYFDLPTELIAQQPAPTRTGSRLLYLPPDLTAAPQHLQFTDFASLLRAGDLLVFNDTRVIPARLFGHKTSGGKVEILLERLLDEHRFLGQLRASKPAKIDSIIHLESNVPLRVSGRVDNFYEFSCEDSRPLVDILQNIGHIPLPPYIERQETCLDNERYQTVYAKHVGAVAAPTAGLHFDESLLAQIAQQGVQSAFVTLHVGAGTFSPIRVDDLSQHVMHKEWLNVSTQVCEQIAMTRQRGGRIIAVGTTSVRALESAAAATGQLQAFTGETQLFITPGYQFKVVDALLTNFHLSESTLLMLVCAFGGYQRMMSTYQQAIEQRYRFFSYGDAMFLNRAG